MVDLSLAKHRKLTREERPQKITIVIFTIDNSFFFFWYTKLTQKPITSNFNPSKTMSFGSSLLSPPHAFWLSSSKSTTSRFKAAASNVPDFLSADWFVPNHYLFRPCFMLQNQFLSKSSLNFHCRFESRKKRPFGPRLDVSKHHHMPNLDEVLFVFFFWG